MGTRELVKKIMWYEELLKSETERRGGDIEAIRADLLSLKLAYDAALLHRASFAAIRTAISDDMTWLCNCHRAFADFDDCHPN